MLECFASKLEAPSSIPLTTKRSKCTWHRLDSIRQTSGHPETGFPRRLSSPQMAAGPVCPVMVADKVDSTILRLHSNQKEGHLRWQ